MLPVNHPKAPVHTYNADGPMRFDEPKGTDAYYEPNSFNGPTQDKRFAGLWERSLLNLGRKLPYDALFLHRRCSGELGFGLVLALRVPPLLPRGVALQVCTFPCE